MPSMIDVRIKPYQNLQTKGQDLSGKQLEKAIKAWILNHS